MELLFIIIVSALIAIGLLRNVGIKGGPPAPQKPDIPRSEATEEYKKTFLSQEQRNYLNMLHKHEHKDRIYGVPGWGLVHEFGEAGAAGEKSEISTALKLAELTFRNKEIMVFNNVQMEATWDIDHIILCGTKMILIDTKNWKSGHKYYMKRGFKGIPVVFRNYKIFDGNELHIEYYRDYFKERYPSFDVVGIVSVEAHSSYITQDRGEDFPFFFINGRNLISTINSILVGERSTSSIARMLLTVPEILWNTVNFKAVHPDLFRE